MVSYGYTVTTAGIPIVGPTESDAVFRCFRPDRPDIRWPVATSLGVHVFGGAYPHPSHRDLLTIRNSVRARVSRNPPKFDKAIHHQFTEWIKPWIRKHFRPLPRDTDVSFETWISGTHYSDSRKDQLRSIHSKMQERPESECFAPKITRVKCFVKDESYKSYKNARGIYSRTDGFKTMVGPIFKAIESSVYKHTAFVKHVPSTIRAQYIVDLISKSGATYISTDYTAFESHFTPYVLKSVEFELYKYMTRDLPCYGKFMRMLKVLTSVNKCSFKDLDVDIRARRMSGEMNTSLGNGFVNLAMFHFTQYILGNRDYACVVEGDDCLGRFFGQVPTSELYSNLGFTVKIDVHRDLCRASFCGLVFSPSNFVSVTDPMKSFMKTGWISARYARCSQHKRLQLLRGKALSMLHQNIGVPIVQSFALYLLRCTPNIIATVNTSLSNYEREILNFSDTPDVAKSIEFETRLVMEQSFGWLVEEQLSIEHYFDNQTQLRPLVHPSIILRLTHEQVDYFSRYVAPLTLGEMHMPLRVARNPSGLALIEHGQENQSTGIGTASPTRSGST